MQDLPLLPDLPARRIREILDDAGGNEIASGKFANPQSSAALAVNGFGWFFERPALLPAFPGLENLDWPPVQVQIERQMRFPWRGGRHPWLDAAIETQAMLIGVESKRYEPFRDRKSASLSEAYDRDVWGEGMERWCRMRDRLRSEPRFYRYLDAAQLVKHAFGLVTEGKRKGKQPVLLYLFAEPPDAGTATAFADHRREIDEFSDQVAGGQVRFGSCSWAEWLDTFTGDAEPHANAMRETFAIGSSVATRIDRNAE